MICASHVRRNRHMRNKLQLDCSIPLRRDDSCSRCVNASLIKWSACACVPEQVATVADLQSRESATLLYHLHCKPRSARGGQKHVDGTKYGAHCVVVVCAPACERRMCACECAGGVIIVCAAGAVLHQVTSAELNHVLHSRWMDLTVCA